MHGRKLQHGRAQTPVCHVTLALLSASCCPYVISAHREHVYPHHVASCVLLCLQPLKACKLLNDRQERSTHHALHVNLPLPDTSPLPTPCVACCALLCLLCRPAWPCPTRSLTPRVVSHVPPLSVTHLLKKTAGEKLLSNVDLPGPVQRDH